MITRSRTAQSASLLYYSIPQPNLRSRRSLVEVKESTEPRTTSHASRHVGNGPAADQAIADPLVISFRGVVRDVLRDGRSENVARREESAGQAFFFDGPHEPFRVGVRIRRTLGREDNTDARLEESTPHVTDPLPVPIANEDVRGGRDRRLGHRQRPHDLLHEERLGMRRGSEDLDAP